MLVYMLMRLRERQPSGTLGNANPALADSENEKTSSYRIDTVAHKQPK